VCGVFRSPVVNAQPPRGAFCIGAAMFLLLTVVVFVGLCFWILAGFDDDE
jgi:hypothetical protein